MLKNNKIYNYNIEMLRIISMFMIIAGHAIGHGNVYGQLLTNDLNFYIVKFFDVIFNSATNIYVLISGYLLSGTSFKIKRVFSIWFQVFFYAFIIFIALVFTKQIDFSIGGLIKVLLPISGNQYWFVRVYLGLYLISPFLNLLINKLNKKQYRYLLGLCVILFSLWPSLIPFATTLNPEAGNSIIWFCTLYFFAGYVKKYGVIIEKVSSLYIITSAFFVFSYVTSIFIPILSNALGFGYKGSSMFSTFTSFPMLFGALGIFGIILKSPQISKGKKFISFFSTSAFSVYLIHDNKYVRDIIWQVFRISKLADKIYIMPYIILISLFIFFICVIIDKATYFLINKWISKIEFKKVQEKISSFLY